MLGKRGRDQLQEEDLPDPKKFRYEKSRLFQVPFEKRQMETYQTPLNQELKNPMNCGVVSTYLLGIIPRTLSETLSVQNKPTGIHDWVNYMNSHATEGVKYSPEMSSDIPSAFKTIRDTLFPGHGTLVGVTRKLPTGEEVLGHFFVIVNLRPGKFHILDPQIRISADEAGFSAYLNHFGLNGNVYVIVTDKPYTLEEFESQYINNFLPNLLTASCKVGGRRKKTVRRRKRKTNTFKTKTKK